MDRLDAAAVVLPGAEVRVVQRCGSTNGELMAERPAGCVLLAAEEQTAGRGRRGRRWHSAPGAGLTFSLARVVRRPARELAALSLVAGVAVARALRALGLSRAALKWPNDLVIDGAKLGGILVETRPSGAASLAVIGVGINCRSDRSLAKRVKREVAALDRFMPVDRNCVLQAVGRSLLEALQEFERNGLPAFARQWESMDAHAGERLRVRLTDGRTIRGIASGLADDGALRLRTRAGVRSVSTGRVMSARAAPAPRARPA